MRWFCRSLILSCVLTGMTSCARYGDVSPATYEHAQALFSVCNRRDAARLDVVEASIIQAHAQQELSDREERWLLAIIKQARQEEWTAATAEARRMMAEQVTRK